MDDDPMAMFMNDLHGEGDRLLTRSEERRLARACEAGLLAQWMLQGNNPENAEARKGVPFTDETMIADITHRIKDDESSPAAKVMAMIGGGVSDADMGMLQAVADEGDAARRRMIECNIRLVVRLAASVRNSRDIMDRIQDGALGLCHGIIKYDWRTGNRLSTYIYHWILQSISREECNAGRLIRIPCHVDAKIRSIHAKEAAAAVNGDTGGTPSVGHHPDPETVKALGYERLLSPVSLDCPLSANTDSTLGDFVNASRADIVDGFEEAEQARLSVMIRRAAAPVLATSDGMITAMLHGFGRRRMTLGEASAITGKGRKALKTADRRGMRSLAAVLEPLALASGDYSEADLSFCFE